MLGGVGQRGCRGCCPVGGPEGAVHRSAPRKVSPGTCFLTPSPVSSSCCLSSRLPHVKLMRKSPLVSQRMLVPGLAGKAGGGCCQDPEGSFRWSGASWRAGHRCCTRRGSLWGGPVRGEFGHRGLSFAFTAHCQLGRLFPISGSHSFLYFSERSW